MAEGGNINDLLANLGDDDSEYGSSDDDELFNKIAGPEGAADAQMLELLELQAAMGALLEEEKQGAASETPADDDATEATMLDQMTPTQKSKACIDDLKLWLARLGIDASALELLLM